MRIALLAPCIPTTLLPRIGGLQEFLIDLAQGLLAKGHHVTLFARDAEFAPGVPTELVQLPDIFPSHASAQEEHLRAFPLQQQFFLDLFLYLRERSAHFDLLHIHSPRWGELVYSLLIQKIPVIHTFHVPPTWPSILSVQERNQALRTLQYHDSPLTFTAVSQSCARLYGNYIPIDHVIYNGVDVEKIPFTSQVDSQAPLLFAGRISPEKGTEAAIEIAEQAGKRLLIAGPIYDRGYYDERIAPRIQASAGQISYLGELKRNRLWETMGQAQGLLFPVQLEEAFGLVPLEALATGTPLIAFKRGAVEELFSHKEIGFLVKPGDISHATALVEDLPKISRTRCRRYVEKFFTLENTLTNYEQLYQNVWERWRTHPPVQRERKVSSFIPIP